MIDDTTNYMAEAMAPAKAECAAKVMFATWGHLEPRRGTSYAGFMLFSYSAYGDITLIEAKWDGLGDSPGLFADMQDYIGQMEEHWESGQVFKFTGTYRRRKNGNGLFRGKVRKINTD